MDKNGYPTEEELETIKNWDLVERPVIELIEYVRERWQYVDYGAFELKGKRILKLELHTCGWSGNESIIKALQDNSLFWATCWEKSTRGGHYYFKIPSYL